MVTFESGTMEKSVSIPILEDNLAEKTEYFTLRLEAIGDVLVFPITESVVAIQDNDCKCVWYYATSNVINIHITLKLTS